MKGFLDYRWGYFIGRSFREFLEWVFFLRFLGKGSAVRCVVFVLVFVGRYGDLLRLGISGFLTGWMRERFGVCLCVVGEFVF